jgi:hypothetical protein
MPGPTVPSHTCFHPRSSHTCQCPHGADHGPQEFVSALESAR